MVTPVAAAVAAAWAARACCRACALAGPACSAPGIEVHPAPSLPERFSPSLPELLPSLVAKRPWLPRGVAPWVSVAMEDPFDDFGLDNIEFYTVVEQFESYVLDTDYLSNVWTETVLGGESLLDANMYSHKAAEAALGTMGGSGRLAALRTSSHGSLLAGGSPSAHF